MVKNYNIKLPTRLTLSLLIVSPYLHKDLQTIKNILEQKIIQIILEIFIN